MTKLWVMRESLENFEHQERIININLTFGFVNSSDISRALRRFYGSLPGDAPFSQPLPADFPTPVLRMPDKSFLPDYKGIRHMVSARMREAMALPLEAAQFLPCQITDDSVDGTRERGYCLMHLRVAQPAMDLEQSDCNQEWGTSHKTGKAYLSVTNVKRLVLRSDIEPMHDLFGIAEHPTTVLATDALAERVQRAGCTGVVFLEPETAYAYESEKRRYRTLDGVVAGLE